jgi:hypothetical protein
MLDTQHDFNQRKDPSVLGLHLLLLWFCVIFSWIFSLVCPSLHGYSHVMNTRFIREFRERENQLTRVVQECNDDQRRTAGISEVQANHLWGNSIHPTDADLLLNTTASFVWQSIPSFDETWHKSPHLTAKTMQTPVFLIFVFLQWTCYKLPSFRFLSRTYFPRTGMKVWFSLEFWSRDVIRKNMM